MTWQWEWDPIDFTHLTAMTRMCTGTFSRMLVTVWMNGTGGWLVWGHNRCLVKRSRVRALATTSNWPRVKGTLQSGSCTW